MHLLLGLSKLGIAILPGSDREPSRTSINVNKASLFHTEVIGNQERFGVIFDKMGWGLHVPKSCELSARGS